MGGDKEEMGGWGLVGGPVGPVVSWAEAQGGFSSLFFCFLFSFYLLSFLFLFIYKHLGIL